MLNRYETLNSNNIKEKDTACNICNNKEKGKHTMKVQTKTEIIKINIVSDKDQKAIKTIKKGYR